ncbi:MAG: nuclear transport factor 2 family protein [Alphaproteobacteria bacterium]|nr:nuclear transport factor 2 family protein [Alphaproteobacteria bacterium]
MSPTARFLEGWHAYVADLDPKRLDDLLAENVLFHAPAYLKPRRGRLEAKLILTNVTQVFEEFRYHRQLVQGNDMVLEFSARIGDKKLKGIDFITVDEAGKAIDFEVMIRPINALQALFEAMMARLNAGNTGARA